MREILLADVALVRSDTGMRQHVLIEVAAGREGFLTEYAGENLRLAMLEPLVAHQFTSSSIFLATLLALEAFLVQSQMIVQPAPVMELLATQMASVFVLHLLVAFLVPPFVAFHVFHLLAAKSTDLQLRDVGPLHVVRQVDLQLVTATAVLAHVLRLVVAVGTHVVPLQAVLAFVLHVAGLALEEVIRPMDHLVLLQRSGSVTRSFAHVAFIRLSVHVGHVILYLLCVVEAFLAEGASVPDLVQNLVHLDLVFL